MDATWLVRSRTPSPRRSPARRRTAVSLLAAVCIGIVGFGGAVVAAQASTTPAPTDHPTRKLCGEIPTVPDRYTCFAEMQTDTVRAFVAPPATPSGPGPAHPQGADTLPSGTPG